MRTIKFKGWDGKKMLEAEDLSIAPKYRKWLGKKDAELMQFTGLKDRNGTPIFEGDIVLDDYLDNTWEVYYDNKSAWFWLRNGHSEEGVMGYWNCSDDPAYPSWDRYEVIGNIYRDSELLKK